VCSDKLSLVLQVEWQMSTGSCLPCVGYRMKAAWLTGTVVCLLAVPHNRPLAQAMDDDIALSGH